MPDESERLKALKKRVAKLRKAVAALKAIEEVRELRRHYHFSVNVGRWREIFDRCTEDVVCRWGEEIPAQVGREVNRAASARVMQSNIAPTFRQFIHCQKVEIKGDEATGLSYMDAYPVQFGRSVLATAAWRDKYVRVDGQWLIKEQMMDFFYQVRLDEGWAQEDRVINPFKSLNLKSNAPTTE